MSKADAITLAEQYRALALEAMGTYDRMMLFDMAGQYYREAGQYNMVIWCEAQR